MMTFAKRNLTVGAMLSVAVLAFPATAWSYTDEQQQACSGDAFRLCSSDIPDIGRVTACMVRRQSELSAGCRVYFRHDESSTKARRPHRLRQRTASEG
jgi:hypothetical protein